MSLFKINNGGRFKTTFLSGDSCCFSFSLGAIKKILENEIPGVEVISIRIGRDTAEVRTFTSRAIYTNIN